MSPALDLPEGPPVLTAAALRRAALRAAVVALPAAAAAAGSSGGAPSAVATALAAGTGLTLAGLVERAAEVRPGGWSAALAGLAAWLVTTAALVVALAQGDYARAVVDGGPAAGLAGAATRPPAELLAWLFAASVLAAPVGVACFARLEVGADRRREPGPLESTLAVAFVTLGPLALAAAVPPLFLALVAWFVAAALLTVPLLALQAVADLVDARLG